MENNSSNTEIEEMEKALELDEETPADIAQAADSGERTNRRSGFRNQSQDIIYAEDVLVDPMTNEEISRTYDIITQEEIDSNPELNEKDLGKKKINKLTGKELFIDRDHWFRIKAKFIWKDASEVAASN